MQTYDYATHTPLQNGMIRLLKLLPGRATSELKGNLITRRLTGTTVEHFGTLGPIEPFNALSYTWGGTNCAKDAIQILVDSEEHPITIQTNLASALRQLRKDQPSFWWIDALCICQVDTAEKNVQLQLMPEIYGRADKVIVWLGEEYENSSAALSFLQKSLFAPNLEQFIREPGRKDEFLGVVHLMKRSWFTRRWVIQEIACARQAHLHCGSASMPWHAFVDAVYQLAAQQDHLRKIFSSLLTADPDDVENFSSLSTLKFLHVVDSMLRKTVEGQITEHLMTLEALLATTPQFETSDPKDTVYALLFLAKDAQATTYEDWLARFRQHHKRNLSVSPAASGPNATSSQQRGSNAVAAPTESKPWKRLKIEDMRKEVAERSKQPKSDLWSVSRLGYALVRYLGLEGYGNPNAIMVDYRKSMLEICRDIIKFVITHSKSIDMLCRPWAPTGIDLPSWVRTKAESSHLPGLNGVYRRVNADPLVGNPIWPIKPYRASSSTKASWSQQGRSLHNLILRGFVLDRIASKDAPATAGIIPVTWAKFGGWHSLNTTPPEAFWRTLVGNRNAEGGRAPYHWGQICATAFERRISGQDFDTSEAVRHDCPQAVRVFLERVQCVTWSRRLVRFDRTGALGVTAKAVKKGDLLCILMGCSVPVVLREYVDGLPIGKSSDPRNFGTLRQTEQVEVPGEPFDESRLHYEFIGEAYVHGMMDGEAYTWNKTRIEPQSFRLQ